MVLNHFLWSCLTLMPGPLCSNSILIRQGRNNGENLVTTSAMVGIGLRYLKIHVLPQSYPVDTSHPCSSLSRIFCGITQVNSVKLRMLIQNGFHPIEYYIPKFYVLFMSGILSL